MTLSADEQYMLELINRARLDPEAEAARYGIGLNDGLTEGTISAAAKEVLAPNALLESAATEHTTWLAANNTLTHQGAGNSLPDDRISASGYPGGSGFNYGEILGVVNMSGLGSPTAIVNELHRLTMLNMIDSADGSSDREALFYESVREAGIEIRTGTYTIASAPWALTHVPLGEAFNAALTTQNFGRVGPDVFLTGVAYTDGDDDGFYSIGEGVAGVGFAVGAGTAATAAAGGYALRLAPGAGQTVTVTAAGGAVSTVVADLSAGNVKLDLVDGILFRSSGSLTLVSGVRDAELLGIADLTLAGNAQANRLAGNRGDNLLTGLDGNDSLLGGAGNDTISGGNNWDTLDGGDGDDQVWGGNGRDLARLGNGNDIFWDNGQADANGHDTVWAGAGNDTVNGGGGNELIQGEDGADSLLGGAGNDTISGGNNWDTIRGGDGDDQVWGGNGRDLVFLGNGNDVFWDNGQADANGHDTVWAGAGNDTVNGGGGNELIQGEAGNDSLLGGAGNDTISGGVGADHFVFAAGHGSDLVTDFESGIDRLMLDDALWGGGLTAAQVIAGHAAAAASALVLDFGGGNMITLAGLAATGLAESDLVII